VCTSHGPAGKKGLSPVDVGSVCPSPELCNEVPCLCAVNTYQSTLERYRHTQVRGCRINCFGNLGNSSPFPHLCRACSNPCAWLVDGNAAHLMLVDTTYHLRGCHLGGLCCQQVLGEMDGTVW